MESDFNNIKVTDCLTIHHLGIAVYDIEESIKQYSVLGWILNGKIIRDEKRNVNIAFMSFLGENNTLLELVSPLNDKSPVTKALQTMKNVSTPYHICYKVNNLSMMIEVLKRRGYILTVPPESAVAFGGRRVAFLLNKNAGLIELLERE